MKKTFTRIGNLRLYIRQYRNDEIGVTATYFELGDVYLVTMVQKGDEVTIVDGYRDDDGKYVMQDKIYTTSPDGEGIYQFQEELSAFLRLGRTWLRAENK